MFKTNWALATYEEFLFCTADRGYGRRLEVVQVYSKNLATNRYNTTPSQILHSDNRDLHTWRAFGNRMVVENGVLLLSDNSGGDNTIHVKVLTRESRRWNYAFRLVKREAENPVQVQAVGYAHPNYAFAIVEGTPVGWFVPVTAQLPCRTPSVDICFTMDRSDWVESGYQEEKDMITAVVDRFHASSGDQVYNYGAVAFSFRVSLVTGLIPSGPEFWRQVTNYPGPDSGRDVDIALGMRTCNDVLNNGSGAIKILVLISGGRPFTNDAGLLSVAAEIKNTKKIITVGAGNIADSTLLKRIASKSRTNVPLHVPVSRPDQFNLAVPSIAADVCKTF